MQLAPTLFFFHMEFCPESSREVEGGGWKAQQCENVSQKVGLSQLARFCFKESK